MTRVRNPEVEARAREKTQSIAVYREFVKARDEAQLSAHSGLEELLSVHRARGAGALLKTLQAHRAGDDRYLNVYGDD